MREPFFRDKKILVIDQSPKTTNDRTWCFWEKETGLFEPVIDHRWNRLQFYSGRFSKELDITPYQYKMIRGIDLYEFIKKESAQFSNIEWRQETVKTVKTENAIAIAVTDKNEYSADYVFNSIHFSNSQTSFLGAEEGGYHLLQHFKGWMIETAEPAFDPSKATFMDFRVNQELGTTFFYVLPVSATAALVEYTLFTENLLPSDAYDAALQAYIASRLQLGKYTITHEEFGMIPMTNFRFPLQEGHVVFTGIAGGQVKGSSGYAFRFIQKRTEEIVASLIQTGSVSLMMSMNDKKFRLYDSVLLNVLSNHKMNGDEIFARIFRHNPPQRVLRFLDNESSLWEDLQIMRSVPASIFLPAALQELTGKRSTFTQ